MSQKSTRSAPAKNENEYATFETALKKVLSVPHSALKAQLDAEKQVPKQRDGNGLPSHASRAKGLETRFTHLASHLSKG